MFNYNDLYQNMKLNYSTNQELNLEQKEKEKYNEGIL